MEARLWRSCRRTAPRSADKLSAISLFKVLGIQRIYAFHDLESGEQIEDHFGLWRPKEVRPKRVHLALRYGLR